MRILSPVEEEKKEGEKEGKKEKAPEVSAAKPLTANATVARIACAITSCSHQLNDTISSIGIVEHCSFIQLWCQLCGTILQIGLAEGRSC